MIDPNLVAMLRCPQTGSTLKLAEKTLVERLNMAIGGGALRDRQGQKINQSIDGALVTSDGQRLYPIRGGIPTMIADESIERSQLAD